MDCPGRILLVAACAAFLHLLAAPVAAEETNLVPTRINAERIEFDYEEGVIYLRGHVVVRDVQGTIVSDNATVYLDKEKTPEGGTDAVTAANPISKDFQSFTRVVAVGNVKMTVDERSAISNKAVWDRKAHTIVLTGGPPKLREGNSYLQATRIVFDTETRECEFHPKPELVFQISDEDRERFAQ